VGGLRAQREYARAVVIIAYIFSMPAVRMASLLSSFYALAEEHVFDLADIIPTGFRLASK
jgi:hypothetical protein